jgi:hypothetical protein
MPLQNRVTPFGEILALPERGLFMGNRGIIHDPRRRQLLRRRWTTKAWIICLCAYRGVRRPVMSRRSWTELFFLDEATALAAGHRPCFFCRRAAAESFRRAWAEARGEGLPSAAEIDAVLHRERLDRGVKRLHPLPMPLASLPDGAMLAAGGHAFLMVQGRALPWTPAGYRPAHGQPTDAQLLTPPSILGALAAGYGPALHPTALRPTALWPTARKPMRAG